MSASNSHDLPSENSPKPSPEGDPTGPPPLPQETDPWFSDWAVIGSVSVLILVTLMLLLFLFSSSPPQDVASSNSNGALSGNKSGDDSNSASSDKAEGVTSVAELPVGNEVADALSQESQQQDNSSLEASEIDKVVDGKDAANVTSGDDEEEATKVDQEEVSLQPFADESDLPSEVPTAKQKTIGHFFTLDAPPKPKQSQRPSEALSDDTAGRESDLSGRLQGNKEDLLQAQGGTATTEAAVKLGLEWLARNQRQNGLWDLRGPFSNGSNQDNTIAASAMALLAFQGAGHTPKGDPQHPFTGIVRNGWKSLLEYLLEKRGDVRFRGLHGGYTEALCTIAICELYGMTKDRRYRKPAIEALEYCLRAQSSQGGWRYLPRQDSDTSVTGWFLMALQSARMAKLKVPNRVLAGVRQYLDAAASHNGERYAYQPGTVASRAMTAEGLLCRQYLGWKREDPRLLAGTDFLLQQLPDWETRDVYYWYYATQVTHHMGGEPWREWNEVIRVLLPAKQIKDGSERGSWDPQGHPHGSAGGRLYVTCMSLYILEVYYRHLPIYQHGAVGNGN